MQIFISFPERFFSGIDPTFDLPKIKKKGFHVNLDFWGNLDVKFPGRKLSQENPWGEYFPTRLMSQQSIVQRGPCYPDSFQRT